MTQTLRGADVVARTLAAAGIRRIFTLSGNHVMSVFDATIEAKLDLVHVRHEAAAVHMADAWARLTGEPGVVLLTGGPGHANGVSALYTALAAESPVVLLSGHAPHGELGRGAFQEMRQADMAAPATKLSATATTAGTVGRELARALLAAQSGRPGPVHLSLPSDVLEATTPVSDQLVPAAVASRPSVSALSEPDATGIAARIARARRPLVLAGPAMMTSARSGALRRLEDAAGVPVIGMESPRGIADPSLGAFAEVLAQADLVVLLGKQLDFTLKFGRPPAIGAACAVIHIDPDAGAIERTMKAMDTRLVMRATSDTAPAADALVRACRANRASDPGWLGEVRAAIAHRPAAWQAITGGDALHPAELCRSVQPLLDADPASVLVCDGGEFGQWAQACLAGRDRVINGIAGSIGSGLPFAAAARMARPAATVVAMSGDGSIGFHLSEFDTAVRYGLPFVLVVGNDACWNAEHQIQLRAYGRDRAIGCELLPTRYDLVAAALGGHGEFVSRAAALPAALARAKASGKPACVNVLTERIAAPTVARN